MLTITLFSLLFVSSVSASLSVKPGKLGILYLTVSPLFPAKAYGSFEIGNTYNYSIDVVLQPTENVSKIMSLSEESFTLYPNDTKKIDYIVTVSDPGVYRGGVAVTASSPNSKMKFGYQADITISVRKSQLFGTILFIALIASAIAILSFISYKIFKRSKKSKKLKTKHLMAAMGLFSFLFLFASSAFAANVAMVVKDASALSADHEQKIYDILNDLGHNVTLVDKNVNVDYFDYDLIVIAGRPYGSSSEGLDSFVSDIPVNEIPTIGIDYLFLDDWGWVQGNGRSSYGTSQILRMYIKTAHPLTQGFAVDQIVDARTVKGYKAVDMVKSGTNFKFVASLDSSGNLGIVAYAGPNTLLSNGERISPTSAAVFIGVNYPTYWSQATEQIFENSVSWLLNLEVDPPTTPVLDGPRSIKATTASYIWTASTDISGIQNYQFQLSKSSSFATLEKDVYVLGLQYTATGLRDGNVYYTRVRAIDNYGTESEWSNVITTIDDYSDISIKINSPTSGSTINLNTVVHVNADATGSRLNSGSVCNISIGGQAIAQIPYDTRNDKCEADVTIPSSLGGTAIGATSFSATISNYLGSAKSDSVPVFLSRSISLPVKTDKSSYSTGENVTVSGKVFVSDNKAAISGATVAYNVSNKTGSVATDSNGQYSFNVSGLSVGNHTVNVKADYNTVSRSNSTLFNVSSLPSSQSSSGGSSGDSGGGGSFAPAPFMSLSISSEITGYAGERFDFDVLVKNLGTAPLHSVKIKINNLDLPVDIGPNQIDIAGGTSQNFLVSIDIPSDFLGKYDFEVMVMSVETTMRRSMSLNVLPVQKYLPMVTADELYLPSFYSGETASVGIKLKNMGNGTAEITESVQYPSDWEFEVDSIYIELEPDTETIVNFDVQPKSSGKIDFATSYLSEDSEISFTNSSDVTVTVKEIQKPPLFPTGLFAAVSDPLVAIPLSVAVIFIAYIGLRFKLGHKSFLEDELIPRTPKSLRQSVSSINPAYKRWENKYRK